MEEQGYAARNLIPWCRRRRPSSEERRQIPQRSVIVEAERVGCRAPQTAAVRTGTARHVSRQARSEGHAERVAWAGVAGPAPVRAAGGAACVPTRRRDSERECECECVCVRVCANPSVVCSRRTARVIGAAGGARRSPRVITVTMMTMSSVDGNGDGGDDEHGDEE